MLHTASLGFPRIGDRRQLKKALESYWKKQINASELATTASQIRCHNWALQQKSNISFIPANDFSFYDHILDHLLMFGAIPERFAKLKATHSEIDLQFAMARGFQEDEVDVTALEMTKWFDTNYHYLVAEFSAKQQFSLNASKIISQCLEAKNLGIETRPVIIGPVSFLLLGKRTEEVTIAQLLEELLPQYQQLLAQLTAIGVKDIQIDEPFLSTDLNIEAVNAYQKAYLFLKNNASDLNLHLVSYFDDLAENMPLAFGLGFASVHLDLVRAPQQLAEALKLINKDQKLSLGLVDGRNIWINNLEQSVAIAKNVVAKIGKDRVIIAPSCSLIHSPVSLDAEHKLSPEVKSWLAFATEKLSEIATIAILADEQHQENQSSGFNIANAKELLAVNVIAVENRKTSPLIHNQQVKNRITNIDSSLLARNNDFPSRKKVQENSIHLPMLPTTTIGSFPQTAEVRKARADFKLGKIDSNSYHQFLQQQIVKVIELQEEIGLDVLVHGEFERNDMVEYFGEQLAGFAFTENGWVQSYGSRCVKPPIIYGDVSRPKPMTVAWAEFAQGKTRKIVKGMLTGPITILQWSFVRNDQPRKDTATQIAFAIRDEVVDLEGAGIKIIQIDEAALREGLPIRQKDRAQYLQWAVDAFRISSSGVQDRTQIHTHMCYSEFNDIIEAIAKMDADVISIETSRSHMELLNAFINFKYPNEIGPGVYDIHSPRVPSKSEMVDLLEKALAVIDPKQIWVNPDCGLKTRDWPETIEALKTMVLATQEIRQKIY